MIKNFIIYRNTKKFTNNSLSINKKDILVNCNNNKKDYEWFYIGRSLPHENNYKYNDKKLTINFTWTGRWVDEINHKKSICKCERTVTNKYKLIFKEEKDYNKVKKSLLKKKSIKKTIKRNRK